MLLRPKVEFRRLSMLLRHAWDTVEFSIPRAFVGSYDMPKMQYSYSIPRPTQWNPVSFYG